jgi:hypothetical protein
MLTQHLKAVALGCLIATTAMATHTEKAAATNLNGGSAEAGLRFVTPSSTSATQFLVDDITLNKAYEASDKVKLVFNNSFALIGADTTGVTTTNSFNYWSRFRITTPVAGTIVGFANSAAYIEHKCMEGMTWSFGHRINPFGMESMMSRYNMPTFFYSGTYLYSVTNNFLYDLGVQMHLHNLIPGDLEVAVTEGRGNGNLQVPQITARYHLTIDSGGTSFTPVLSGFWGNASAATTNIGFSGGLMAKISSLLLNAEFLYTKLGTAANANWSLYVEPGIDLGMLLASVKWQLESSATATATDMHIGAALTKNFSDKLRARLLYQLASLSKVINTAGPTHEFRLQFGTSW